MSYRIIRLRVKDYAKWRASFAEYAAKRREFGATGNDRFYRDKDDPNVVTLVVEWRDEQRAREWYDQPQWKNALPDINIVEILDNRSVTAG